MKTNLRLNRQSGTTKRKIARLLSLFAKYENDHARRHAIEQQRRYRKIEHDAYLS